MAFDISNEVKLHLRDYVESITQRDRSAGANKYCCPICGSGTHGGAFSDGAFTIFNNGTRWHCFSCHHGGDILDLVGIVEHIDSKPDQLKRVQELYSIPTTGNQKTEAKQPVKEDPQPEADYTKQYEIWEKDLPKAEPYLKRRGISLATAGRFHLGYCENWKHPKNPYSTATPRLIIPTSKSSYLARDTREAIPEDQQGISKKKAGKTHIFNLQGLYQSEKPVFITEGEIDAISIMEVGGQAVGLGSVGMADTFLKEIDRIGKPDSILLLALDTDEAGKKATEKLADGLIARGINFFDYSAELCGTHKDPNEALTADRAQFTAIIENAGQLAEAFAETEAGSYLENSAASMLSVFENNVRERQGKPYLSTGFDNFDTALGGGLFEGDLYILGAISSLGKTSFCLQTADNLAQSGQDVLMFSLEMGRDQLIAKSLSRISVEVCMEEKMFPDTYAMTARQILNGNYTWNQKSILDSAKRKFLTYADHIFIKEFTARIGIAEIEASIQEHMKYTRRKPVVMIDYLQILKPASDRMTDKQSIDAAVSDLKRITRQYGIAVIAVSSFNRAAYAKTSDGSARRDSFKESGSVEYSSDCLLALESISAGTSAYDEETEMKQYPREVRIKVLKNRLGECYNSCDLKFYSKFNYFTEC